MDDLLGHLETNGDFQAQSHGESYRSDLAPHEGKGRGTGNPKGDQVRGGAINQAGRKGGRRN